eukprot:7468934-Alexandrium_andersonii.AAC.1
MAKRAQRELLGRSGPGHPKPPPRALNRCLGCEAREGRGPWLQAAEPKLQLMEGAKAAGHFARAQQPHGVPVGVALAASEAYNDFVLPDPQRR